MIGIVIGALVIVAYLFLRRSKPGSGVVQLSHLKCTKCNSEFDYAWIPGGSLTSVRLGKSRLIRCPVCKKWSLFNIWDTRVDPKTHPNHLRIGPNQNFPSPPKPVCARTALNGDGRRILHRSISPSPNPHIPSLSKAKSSNAIGYKSVVTNWFNKSRLISDTSTRRKH